MTIELLTQKEAADLLKISTKTLARWRKSGLRCVKLGRMVRYRAGDIAEYTAKNLEESPCHSEKRIARSGNMTARSHSKGSVIGFAAALASEAKPPRGRLKRPR